MRKVLLLGFLLMGFSFTVTQGLMIRELLVAFNGNELSIGLILGSWLILEALGSGILGRVADRWRVGYSAFAVLQILFALFLPLCLYGTQASRAIAGASPGEGIGLGRMVLSSMLILTPLALVDGAMFSIGYRAYASLTSNEAPSVGRVYVIEALGAIAGGILFTYLMIPLLLAVQIVLVLSVLNLLAAAALLALNSPRKGMLPTSPGFFAVLSVLAIALGLLSSPWLRSVQQTFSERQYAGLELVYSRNSMYGNVAVTQQGGQYTFYADGIPILTAPDPDIVLAEEISHLPMLFVPQPQRAMVLSGGLGGVLDELSKYPFDKIDYAELDPLLIEAVREFPTSLTEAELSNARIRVEAIDGQVLVRRTAGETDQGIAEHYDLVIVNVPYPSSLQLNRSYTAEFFGMVRRILDDQGVLVVTIPGSMVFMGDELRDLNASLFRTLDEVFPHVRPIPGDVTLWLASPYDAISNMPLDALLDEWNQRDLETHLMSRAYIAHKLDERRLDWFLSSIASASGSGPSLVNRDLHPVGVFYGLAYSSALFSPALAPMFSLISQLRLPGALIAVAVLALLVLAASRLTAKGKKAVIPFVLATTGFAGMTISLVVTYTYQTFFGHVYHWIALLITAFMAGLSLGGVLMTRRLAKGKNSRAMLMRIDLVVLVFCGLLAVALAFLQSTISHRLVYLSAQGLLLILNVLGGFLVGAQFPISSHLWMKGASGPAATAGALYAADLIGACLGAVLVSVVLIPVLGSLETCLIAATLKLGSLMILLPIPSRA